MSLDPTTLQSLHSLLLGFAFAGLLASGFELLAERPASLRLLETGRTSALAFVPVLVFAAPFIILRGAVLRPRFERPSARAVMAATLVAGLWSLMSGRVVLDLTHRLAGA